MSSTTNKYASINGETTNNPSTTEAMFTCITTLIGVVKEWSDAVLGQMKAETTIPITLKLTRKEQRAARRAFAPTIDEFLEDQLPDDDDDDDDDGDWSGTSQPTKVAASARTAGSEAFCDSGEQSRSSARAKIAAWEPLTVDNGYEICTSYPYQIRRKTDGKEMTVTPNGPGGYPVCTLNGKQKYMHKIVAQQWINNPEGYSFVDHIDRVRSNFHISNLRWINESGNSRNRSRTKGIVHEYFDELPAGSRPLVLYNGHDLEGYSFDREFNVYVHNGLKFRKLFVNMIRGIYPYVSAMSVTGKQILISIARLRDENNEL